MGRPAGAILTAEVHGEIKTTEASAFPQPPGFSPGLGDLGAALVIRFSLFALNGFSGHLDDPDPNDRSNKEYTGSTPLNGPGIVSAVCRCDRISANTVHHQRSRSSTKRHNDFCTVRICRAGVDAQLVVFEALPHAFWNNPALFSRIQRSRSADGHFSLTSI